MVKIVTVDPDHPDPSAIALAADILKAGGLVAFPTETVYGLGANACDPVAVAKIFEAKGRPANNPVIVHVTDADMAKSLVQTWPDAAEHLAKTCWPGPLTLLLQRASQIPDMVTAGLPAVGVRVPEHPVALALIRATGLPIAAPSANPYTGVSPTSAQHVARGLGDRVDLILDGGPSRIGVESTVLDLTASPPRVLRPGGLSLERLRELLGTVEYEPRAFDDTHAMPSPGLARRHYAPRARVWVLPDASSIALEAQRLAGEGPVGTLTFGPPQGLGERMPTEPQAYAARLYAALHAADEHGLRHLLIEAPPDTESWAAVNDRLRRAQAPLEDPS